MGSAGAERLRPERSHGNVLDEVVRRFCLSAGGWVKTRISDACALRWPDGCWAYSGQQ